MCVDTCKPWSNSSIHPFLKGVLTLSMMVAALDALTVMDTMARVIPTAATTNTYNKKSFVLGDILLSCGASTNLVVKKVNSLN